MARYPVDSVSLASGYGYRLKAGAQQGHWGYDLAGAAGTKVRTPERLTVTRVWTDDKTPPFVGYGPGGMEGLGESGVYHLLAHLEPSSLIVEVGDELAEGALVGEMSALNHVHWEVRIREIDDPTTREANTLVPLAWMTATIAGKRWTAADIARPGSAGWMLLLLLWLLAGSKR